MELTIETTKQASLKRTRVLATVSYQEETTPSRAAIQAEIAKKAKVQPEVVIVKRIDPAFGKNESMVEAYAYDSVDVIKDFESPYMVKRNEIKAPESEAKEE